MSPSAWGENSGALDIENKLENVFRRVHEQRMRDVPLLNRSLDVAAIGFRRWDDYWVGVLITPWAMNIVLLPRDGAGLREGRIGAKIIHTFPSGDYEFIAGDEQGIGPFEVCSLFSPMHDFSDQAAAIATAEAVLDLLFTVPVRQAPKDTRGLHGKLSRRDVLRGAFWRSDA